MSEVEKSTLGGPNWSPSYHYPLWQFPTHPWGVAQSIPGRHKEAENGWMWHQQKPPPPASALLPPRSTAFKDTTFPLGSTSSLPQRNQQFTITHGTSPCEFFKGLLDTFREPTKWNQSRSGGAYSYSRMSSESGLPCTTIYISLTEITPKIPANLRTGDIVLHQDPAWLLTNLELPHDANERTWRKLGPPNYPHQNNPHQK